MERSLRKTKIGIVTSDKMDKTITVKVETKVAHPVYKKRINRTTVFKAHENKTKLRSVTRFKLWKPDLCQKLRDGASFKSLRKHVN